MGQPTVRHKLGIVRALTLLLCATAAARPALSQTPELAADAQRVIATLDARGITDRESLFAALQLAWDSERDSEYAALRSLGISASNGVFDGSWQNQPGRAAQFQPYDVQMWTYDVIRSWGKMAPREAFTWLYATQAEFGHTFGEWQPLSRVASDWARIGAEDGAAAERESLALEHPHLRQLAIHGVIRGNILRGDREAADALMPHLTDERLQQDAVALYRQYFGAR